MQRLLSMLAVVGVLLIAPVLGASAQISLYCQPGQAPEFGSGSAALKIELGDTMGVPQECEHANPENGDTLQQTSTGLSFIRQNTSTPTFTNGWDHWALTASGVVYWAGDSIDPPAAVPSVGGARPGPLVALTFDAGADRGYAEDILDTLRAQRVPASFGLTGRWARANPDLVRRMAAEGHLVLNHTLDHRSFTGASDQRGGLAPAQRRAQLEEADAVLAPLIGHSTRPWYRLPYGDGDARVAADVAPAGYTRQAGWTVDSLGWRGLGAGEIVARCLRLAAPGAVYVLHVGRAAQDGPALAGIIAGLRERGYGFATLADLP
jgi:peptidoglycan-N-acetylglucosamine deacetylase